MILLEDIHGELRELFGVKARVVADQYRGIAFLVVDVPRDGGDGEADVGEGEIVGNQAAPARSAELDGGRSHGTVF